MDFDAQQQKLCSLQVRVRSLPRFGYGVFHLAWLGVRWKGPALSTPTVRDMARQEQPPPME